ncbi:MAG: hypothetical protein J6V05_01080 [Alistipes sp.]|nr:hypothetical protein [Alistipes sp.]
MAKSAGHIRASKWENSIYHEGGVRKEYGELSDARKAIVKAELKSVQAAMWGNLESKSVVLKADGKEIRVGFTKSGTDHAARDAMLTLSGKYMSRKSMINIDTILQQSEYVPTSHELYKGRKDGIEYFFKYKDKQGRGIYFKIAYEPAQGQGKKYYLRSVTDI